MTYEHPALRLRYHTCKNGSFQLGPESSFGLVHALLGALDT
jgi:hypothetical protein